jgi:hypothetical protein
MENESSTEGASESPAKVSSPQARRALAEAEERRRKARELAALPREFAGRDGPEPTRYGDWEVKGIASDF